jgi:uncharacterized membrane protein YfcA
MTEFPISGIELQWWLPPLIAFVAAGLSSMAGVSGAFLLLPIQVSLLGIAGPVVSSTNLFYNIVAIPSGVYRYLREQRIIWPLVWAISLGILPGIVAGAIIRIKLMPDPATFKPFAGLVLLYIAVRMVQNIVRTKRKGEDRPTDADSYRVQTIELNPRHCTFEFNGRAYQSSTGKILLFSLAVGVVGGAYGVGGGALLAPALVAIFRLPIHTIAGTTLLTTFLASGVGVGVYAGLGRLTGDSIITVSPDWMLGALFGLGGMIGMYVGARLQRLVPARYIKVILTILILTVALRYLATLFT